MHDDFYLKVVLRLEETLLKEMKLNLRNKIFLRDLGKQILKNQNYSKISIKHSFIGMMTRSVYFLLSLVTGHFKGALQFLSGFPIIF